MWLVVNAGSSSIKTALFDAALTQVVAIDALEIGGDASLKVDGVRYPTFLGTHADALDAILTALSDKGYSARDLTGAGHRVVHGGATLTAPTKITPDSLAQIRSCVSLAPLHNPHNIAGIEALAARAPDLPQVACFDTAFHAGQDPLETTYALPPEDRAKGYRRYGFHGLSYEGLVRQMGDSLPRRLLACHLGNGASLCAIRDGRSVATTMGYSPLAGLPMGTRVGDIDPGLVLAMVERDGVETVAHKLNKASGMTGLTGTNDMIVIESRDDAEARFAINHYGYSISRQAGALISVMGGLDAVAFTGGIGENSAQIRDTVMARLAWLGDVAMHVIPADEERQIALDMQSVLTG